MRHLLRVCGVVLKPLGDGLVDDEFIQTNLVGSDVITKLLQLGVQHVDDGIFALSAQQVLFSDGVNGRGGDELTETPWKSRCMLMCE